MRAIRILIISLCISSPFVFGLSQNALAQTTPNIPGLPTALPAVPKKDLGAAKARATAAKKKVPDANPLAKTPDSKLVDQAILKANELERLLTIKVEKIISAHVPNPLLSRSSVSVSMDRYELPAPTPEVDPTKNKNAQNRPDAPIAEGSLFDVQRIIDHYTTEMDVMKAQNRPIQISLKHENEQGVDNRAFYEVSTVRVLASLDEKVAKETRDAIESDTKAAFEPIFGTRLDIKVQPAKLYPVFWDRFFERAQKLQYTVIALVLALASLAVFLMNKLIPSWQAKKPKLTDVAEKI